MTKKAKLPRYVTPLGTAQYPWLTKPDTKFNPDGDYSVALTFRDDDGQFSTLINNAVEESVAKAKEENKGKKIKESGSPITENDDGSITLKFKLKAKVTPKNGESFEQRPALFDAKGTPLSKDTKIGGGTKMKVAFELVPFYTALAGAGVSLRLKAAQVIDLVEYAGGGDGSAYGFGKEDGYEAKDTPAEEQNFETTVQEETTDF
ncbi:MAG: hypothetical protein B7X60_00170 [Polynucleobacter sp. 39-45-136]|jgi:hypothetical protein|nr:MAG: hypothetical protein B7X60_00170 [Polynucleobacter sp. 39-45-136]